VFTIDTDGEGMSLKRDVGIGLFWVAIATAGSKGLSLLRKLILARLLVPSDFGLVAYASLTIGVLDLFKEMGFSSALIYREEDVEEASNTTFIDVIASSILLYAVAWFA
jgi:O-antigen/teichoic acid export membrane protein